MEINNPKNTKQTNQTNKTNLSNNNNFNNNNNNQIKKPKPEFQTTSKSNDCVQYMSIFSALSSSSSSSTPKNQINLTSSGEAKPIEATRGIPLPGVTFDEANLQVKFKEHEKFGALYINQGKFSLGKDFIIKFSESQIKNSIKSFFDSSACAASLLFLSGHGQPGEFHLETAEGEKALKYKEIAEMWQSRKSKFLNKFLLIVIDSCYSGSWVAENIEGLHFAENIGIFVQASCQRNEKSSDVKEKGGLLIWNFIELNTKKQNCEMEILKNLKGISQQPCCSGFYFKIEKVFKLYLMCESWADFYIPDFQEKYEAEGFYEGELNSVNLKHGKGSFNFDDGSCYEGEFKNDEFDGKGIFYFENGNVYEGDWKKGKKNGKGVFNFYTEKIRYEGEFENDVFSGKGKISDFNGVLIKEGLFRNGELISGRVIYNSENEEFYEGEFKSGRKNGKGVYCNKVKGEKYIGFFKDDKKSGFGIFFDKFGNETKSNSWENDRLNGFAVKTFCDKDVYKGFFKNDVFDGFGVYAFGGKAADYYEGEYLEDKMHGIGIRFCRENCEVFVGEFNDDEKVFGNFEFCLKKNENLNNEDNYKNDYNNYNYFGIDNDEYLKKEIYQGEVFEDNFHGWGIFRTENDEVYEGEFNIGKYEGFGILRFSNGNVYEGNFIDNEFNGKGLFKWTEEICENEQNAQELFYFKNSFDDCEINEKQTNKKIKNLNKNEDNFFFNEDEAFISESSANWRSKTDKSSSAFELLLKQAGKNNGNTNQITNLLDELHSDPEASDFNKNNFYNNNSNKEFKSNIKICKKIKTFKEAFDTNNISINTNSKSILFLTNTPNNNTSNNKTSFKIKSLKTNINSQTSNNNSSSNLKPQKKTKKLKKEFYFCGDWVANRKHGKGSLLDFNGLYIGEFVEDEKSGEGRLIYPDSQEYKGEFKQNKRNGKGEMHLLNGEKYFGQFSDDKFHGEGIYFFSNSIYFKGSFKYNKRNGAGIFVISDFNGKTVFKGEWKDDLKNGKMLVCFNEKKKFECFFANDEILEGKGKLEVLGEYIYEGEINKRFIKEGKGKISYFNKDEYEGEFKNDEKNGIGKHFFSSTGEVYQGNWENDLMSGLGKMVYANKCEYFGYWRNSSRNGQGTFKWPDGRSVSGIWEDNQIKKIFD